MTKKHQFLSFLIGLSLFSCNSAKHSIPSISNIDTDFPVTEKLKLTSFNTYDILVRGGCVIDDSVLWHFERGEHDFGSCYDLNTGKKLSTIASRGKAVNELIDLDKFEIIGDSLLLYVDRNTIKTFAKKNIIDNIPVGERKFSVAMAPDSVLVSQMIKLPNNSVLATISPAIFESEKAKINEINKKSIVIFNNGKANAYETITYDSFDVGKAKGSELAANDLIKYAYAQGSIAVKNNDTAVFSVNDQFILYTFDLNSGNVVNEKKYTRIQREEVQHEEGQMSFTTINDRSLNVGLMKRNEKYILCAVDGYFSEKDKNSGLRKKAIFVFDWDLNPIKKFDLPDRKKGYYSISNDCKSVYFCEYNRDGLTLYKADLAIKQ